MIISHRYRYIFIENPLTATWSLHKELYQYYDGSPILHKYATFQGFWRIASEKEREYFLFITVRNPLDKLVSRYLKYKYDARGAFSDPQFIEKNLPDYSDQEKFK